MPLAVVACAAERGGTLECEIADATAPDADCPSDFVCDGQLCVDTPPSITFVSPGAVEFGESFPESSSVAIVLAGSGFNLGTQEEGSSPGFIRVTLDGRSVDITSGPLDSGIVVDQLEVPSNPGAHRLSAQVFRIDGEPFANESALATRLFWIDDGLPHVALISPWDGERLETSNLQVDFEVAVLNFQLSEVGNEPEDGFGHAHVYYDSEFPACVEDPLCDIGYIAVVAPTDAQGNARSAKIRGALPSSEPGNATLTVVLRKNNHEPFSLAPPGEPLQPVTDQVAVSRVDPED